jgi:hypothetical protein
MLEHEYIRSTNEWRRGMSQWPISEKSETELGSYSELWRHFYQLGCLLARSRNLIDGMTYLIDAFLIRGRQAQGDDLVWIDFFRRQFTIYLMGKKQVTCSLCEGDMIHDYLRDEYHRIMEELQGSELPFKEENLTRWFASIELDFPWIIDSLETKCAHHGL